MKEFKSFKIFNTIALISFIIFIFTFSYKETSNFEDISFRLVRAGDNLNIPSRIDSTLGERKTALGKAIAELNDARKTLHDINQIGRKLEAAEMEVKRLESVVEGLINEINRYGSNSNDLTVGEISNLSGFLDSSNYQKYFDKAIDLILNGGYVPQMYFAGAASRLKQGIEEKLGSEIAKKLAGPMYFVNIWQIAEALGYEVPEYASQGITMGTRQLIQLNAKFTQLANEKSLDPQEVLSKQKIVLHINSEIEQEVRRDLIENDFYGFNSDNIAIVVQPVLEGYAIDEDGNVVGVSESEKFPYGHGYATMQIDMPGQGYTINRDNKKNVISGTVKDYILARGGEFIAGHRINDMTKWTDKVIDLQKLAYSLYLMNEKGHNMVVDLVQNVPNQKGEYQKGGLYLKDGNSGRNILLESLNAKDLSIQEKLSKLNEQFKGIPYNAFRQITLLEAFSPEGLRWNIRVRGDDNNIYPELVTGDLAGSIWANSVGVMREGEIIEDFKKLEDLEAAIKELTRSDILTKINTEAQKGTFGNVGGDVVSNVREWMDEDVYGNAWEDIKELVDNENWHEIADAFYRNAAFETAGMRGKMGVGPNRINIFAVRRVSQAVADDLLSRFYADTLEQKPYLISFDTREGSEEFAREAASILAANGIKVKIVSSDRPIGWFSHVLPKINAIGGMMITASHNPVGNNGIKLSDYYGGQLLPEVGQSISDSYPSVDLTEVKSTDYVQAVNQGLIEELDSDVDKEYINHIVNLTRDERLIRSEDRILTRIIYDALFGTDRNLTPAVLEKLGYDITQVKEHAVLDPQFTGLEVPNPTHPGALDLARKYAEEILGSNVQWRQLTGNEVWSIVTEYLLSYVQQSGADLGGMKIVESWATTGLIESIAEGFGVETIKTPVGFKWIGKLMSQNSSIIAGFEESNGATLAAHSREKDGVLTAAIVAEAISWLNSRLNPGKETIAILSNDVDGDRLVVEIPEGSVLAMQLENIKAKYGYIENDMINLTFEGPQGMIERDSIVQGLIVDHPKFIGELKVVEVQDSIQGVNDGVKIILEDGASILLRKSGTEPKLRIYLEVKSHTSTKNALKQLQELKDTVIEWFDRLRK